MDDELCHDFAGVQAGAQPDLTFVHQTATAAMLWRNCSTPTQYVSLGTKAA